MTKPISIDKLIWSRFLHGLVIIQSVGWNDSLIYKKWSSDNIKSLWYIKGGRVIIRKGVDSVTCDLKYFLWEDIGDSQSHLDPNDSSNEGSERAGGKCLWCFNTWWLETQPEIRSINDVQRIATKEGNYIKMLITMMFRWDRWSRYRTQMFQIPCSWWVCQSHCLPYCRTHSCTSNL